ncbi:MAG: helix-turn-helix domain-containing protein [Syntrophobacteraceae bacterium]
MKELAEFLQSERSRRCLTLESVSEQSAISVRMLVSLEQGDFGRFGAPILARNTIRAYCKVLGIDADPLIEKYSAEIEKCSIQDIGIKRYGEQMKILRRKRRMVSFPLLLLLLSSAAVFYGGIWISEKRAQLYAPPMAEQILSQEDLPAELRQKLGPAIDAVPHNPRRGTHVAKSGLGPRDADNAINNAENHLKEAEKARVTGKTAEAERTNNDLKPESLESLVQQNPGTPAKLALSNSTEAVADDRAAAAPDALQKFRFAVEADDTVWIQVKIDNKLTRSAMLRHGEKREWSAIDNMQVIVGNAGGIRMKWNEQAIKAPREQGRVLRFRLPDYVKEPE